MSRPRNGPFPSIEHRAEIGDDGYARWIPADEVALAVEVESPTGLRRDRETKRDEYAEIGIASYWRMERRPVLAVVAYALVGASYEDAQRLSDGRGELHGPVPLTVDLDALRGPGRGQ